jgi:hypothetical protein
MNPLITTNIVGPFSLAIDWLTDKIYLAQKTTSRLDAFSSDGLNRTNILASSLAAPTCVTLDVTRSFLFVADAGNQMNLKMQAAKIERANMDGTSRRVIVKDKLLEPTSLTLDIVKQRLYWIDKKYDHLETCDYYGRRRHIIASG